MTLIFNIFTNIYYFSTAIFLFAELQWILFPIEQTNKARLFSLLSKTMKDKKWKELPESYKNELMSRIWVPFILVWTFVGLFTFQWTAFLLLLLFNFCIIAPFSRITKFSIWYTIINWANSVIGVCFGIFIVVNHYHLKIDLTKYFSQFF